MKGVSINVSDGEKTRLWIIQNITNGQMYVINLDTKQCLSRYFFLVPSSNIIICLETGFIRLWIWFKTNN